MTAIVGVLCRDGVVLGTDSSATFGSQALRTIEQPFEKLDIIEGRVIVAGTGAIGLGQRFCEVVKNAWGEKVFTKPELEVGKTLSREMLNDFISTHVQPRQFAALVAFSTSKQPHLCEFDQDTLQPELKTDRLWYCSLGSSQPITDPFLGLMRQVFWEKGLPAVQDAVFVVTWAIQHAIDLNPGGVNGPAQVAVLEKDASGYAARILTDGELDEHRQSIDEAKSSLRDFRGRLQVGSGSDVPEVPTATPEG